MILIWKALIGCSENMIKKPRFLKLFLVLAKLRTRIKLFLMKKKLKPILNAFPSSSLKYAYLVKGKQLIRIQFRYCSDLECFKRIKILILFP